MDWADRISAILSDERLLFNAIGVHAAIAVLLIVSVIVRGLLQRGVAGPADASERDWLRGATRGAIRQTCRLISWSTTLLILGAIIGGIAYHIGGGDVREDFPELWQNHVTPERLVAAGWTAGQLVAILLVALILARCLRPIRNALKAFVLAQLPTSSEADARSIQRGLDLIERAGVLFVGLVALGVATSVLGRHHLSHWLFRMAIPLLGVLLAARLLTMTTKTISHALVNLGNRHLARPGVRRYWDRFLLLVPFTEKCFEAAVYSGAAAMGLFILRCFTDQVKDFTPRVLICIGVFFGTRVLIELSHVLLKQAFGLYDDNPQADQKGQTLVPLLQSAIQYVLYFASGTLMFGELGGNTSVILAGASFLGLAVGLGAQSLVGDLVSGFFILFENQYLVGDIVQIGDASGRVEAIAIRHTQIRDEDGKLHIVPNGQIKTVVNCSKGFVNAVVDIKVPTTASLEQTMRDMAEAGKRLKSTRREV
ncbi:MAG TPA: mechanosensitive ion channel domain-containing protein, partial [Gemmataceae bacterium]|nr:mechanosensitive ion channel domain-containing protein [Gemmataceae bacterium]